MQKVSTGAVLLALCEEIPITRQTNRPITKAMFKNAMLSSELFTSSTSINLRWDQLFNKVELIKDRGTVSSRKMQYITLDPDAVERALHNDGYELPCMWDTPEKSTHTHTHTHENAPKSKKGEVVE